MVLNIAFLFDIAFLFGGAFVGYLLRGEINRRKTNKSLVKILEASAEALKGLIDAINEKKSEEKKIEDEIKIDDIVDEWNSKHENDVDLKIVSNSSDETINI